MVLNTSTSAKSLYQKKRQSIDNSMIRFPKLDECAHFHYEFAELINFHVSLITNESYTNRSNASSLTNIRNLYLFVRVQCSNRNWTVRRNLQDFRFLDIQLHKCVFDRKHSKLKSLDLTYFSSFDSLESIVNYIAQYLDRLSQIIGGFLTCGPVLHWFEMDNRGNRLINEESDINTPAIGAAFVIKKHNKSDIETEISLEIGELVSVLEMPPVNESIYWKGKKGFEVGFFPAECVQLIDDKISRKPEELSLRPLNKCKSPTLRHRSSDLNSSISSENDDHLTVEHYPDQMRKNGLIAALFRTFGVRRRDQLKRSGILKERVFGCDLCEHLANSGHDLPLVLTACSTYIESYGLKTNGIYRLSGLASMVNQLRAVFDEDRVPFELTMQPDLLAMPLDVHVVSSLMKLYFRELPNPLLTYSLYDSFVSTMRDESLSLEERLQAIRALVISLPPPHWRTLRVLIRHLAVVSKYANETGMTVKNLAIVWAPNLLRSRALDLHIGIEAFHVIGTQAVLTEFLIANCDRIFDREEHEIHPTKSLYHPFVYSKQNNKSPPVSSKCLKYIDVGPEIVPGKYHTIISYRPTQVKRSKFNLQNWKKFQFFTTRNHNGRHRPHLFSQNGEENFCILRKMDKSHQTFSHDSQLSNESYVYGKVENNKPVKRSQSFDSYFKKLRTHDSLLTSSNDLTCDQFTGCKSHNDESRIDINRNHLRSSMITNETIFEVEEMCVDETSIPLNDDKAEDVHNSPTNEVPPSSCGENIDQKPCWSNNETKPNFDLTDISGQQQDIELCSRDSVTKAADLDAELQLDHSSENSSSLPLTPLDSSSTDITDNTSSLQHNVDISTSNISPKIELNSDSNASLCKSTSSDSEQILSDVSQSNSMKHPSIDQTTSFESPQNENDSLREKIEKIKEDRRNQIRQRFAKPITPNLPEIVNSSPETGSSEGTRLRNPTRNSSYVSHRASIHSGGSAQVQNHESKVKNRRSVPNVEFQTLPDGVQLRNSKVAQESKVAEEKLTNAASVKSSPVKQVTRPRITVIPLQTVNKRQRMLDTNKRLAQLFEKKVCDEQ